MEIYILRAHNEDLDIPSFTEDGGEEPELFGCYVIDEKGKPFRLGFSVGNEWSDHAMEKVNYLWLAPSKMRTCAVGPELIVPQNANEFFKVKATSLKTIRIFAVCAVLKEITKLYITQEIC